MISLLVAMDTNRLIGKDNQLPWHLPQDLAYFKKTTLNHKIVMGRKTFESIGRPLPGRVNIIVTRDQNYSQEGCLVLHSIEDIKELSEQTEEEIFVIGGAEIFQQILPYSDRLYITHIHHEFEGDTYFPKTNEEEWEMVKSEKGIRDEKNPFDYEFVVYEKKASFR
ncbi:dihydrofolate reductase [Metabacillus litoralis]|uniref:dihydrofolate reductase n=1 Tax=Metabacillus litoralis TaxID=152268 RepID=UPI000EF55CEF|nr:dihydrofolate reductase [Metabacillus litoralis]MCM3162995.1 dihydrofolate reductase [Metabacillus litoralis]MCM3410701.1 dihydrofolate reductase [Metabacillus litoralis]UHA58212.1 dihydrofolate reductase [Metabacillus litoralis]